MESLKILWQLPQTALGVMIHAFSHVINKVWCVRTMRGDIVGDYVVINLGYGGKNAFSLGKYIFICSDYSLGLNREKFMRDYLPHEYGHSIQSSWLGPAFIVVIISSLLLRSVLGKAADKYWPEKQAWSLGRKYNHDI